MRRGILLSVLLMFLIIPVVALAHPGRTDSNGGHTDSSTGEYHYHHGYPAHDHYDMDGDGDIDCPYDFKDKTNHSSGNDSWNNTDKSNNRDMTNNTNTPTKPNTQSNVNSKGNSTYNYIAVGFVIAFFIFVNCWAIHIDKTDTAPCDEPMSLPSIFISIFSTLIVFALLFSIMYLYKKPITWREISFKEMIQALFASAIFGSIVWLVTNWASLIINTLLSKLFKTEVCGWIGAFQRLTIPLSYAFTVFLFILQ